MIVMALELSTPRASIALLNGNRVLAEAAWEEPQSRHQRIFAEAPILLKQAGLTWSDVDSFVVGRGPGAFSGIRIGLMAAQMFALPQGRPVCAVSSAEALALETGPGRVLVCGDARRGMFWFGMRTGNDAVAWDLCKADAWPERVAALKPDRIVTSQWERTLALREAGGTAGWVEGDRFPTAAGLALLAASRPTSEPRTPIYLHPPV